MDTVETPSPRRTALWWVLGGVAVLMALVVWVLVASNQAAADRSATSEACRAAVVEDMGVGVQATVLTEYVGHPGGAWEFTAVDTGATNTWTCLVTRDGDAWDVSLIG